jgi:hypothetical protein
MLQGFNPGIAVFVALALVACDSDGQHHRAAPRSSGAASFGRRDRWVITIRSWGRPASSAPLSSRWWGDPVLQARFTVRLLSSRTGIVHRTAHPSEGRVCDGASRTFLAGMGENFEQG